MIHKRFFNGLSVFVDENDIGHKQWFYTLVVNGGEYEPIPIDGFPIDMDVAIEYAMSQIEEENIAGEFDFITKGWIEGLSGDTTELTWKQRAIERIKAMESLAEYRDLMMGVDADDDYWRGIVYKKTKHIRSCIKKAQRDLG